MRATWLGPAMWMMMAGCGGGPKLPPTPIGLVGAPYDMRQLLPPEVEKGSLDVNDAFGHVLQLGDAGYDTTLRIRAWTATDEDIIGSPTFLSAVAVEVMENPNGTQVTWRAFDPDPAKETVRLEIDVRFRGGSGDLDLSIPGRMNSVNFVPDAAFKP